MCDALRVHQIGGLFTFVSWQFMACLLFYPTELNRGREHGSDLAPGLPTPARPWHVIGEREREMWREREVEREGVR